MLRFASQTPSDQPFFLLVRHLQHYHRWCVPPDHLQSTIVYTLSHLNFKIQRKQQYHYPNILKKKWIQTGKFISRGRPRGGWGKPPASLPAPLASSSFPKLSQSPTCSLVSLFLFQGLVKDDSSCVSLDPPAFCLLQARCCRVVLAVMTA